MMRVLPPPQKKTQLKGQVSPLASSPTNSLPFLLSACVFDFLSPVPLSPGIISTQAHTKHCKIISLGNSHRKWGRQILSPHNSWRFSACLKAQVLHWASAEVASSNLPISLHLIKYAPSLPKTKKEGWEDFGINLVLWTLSSDPFSAFSPQLWSLVWI